MSKWIMDMSLACPFDQLLIWIDDNIAIMQIRMCVRLVSKLGIE